MAPLALQMKLAAGSSVARVVQPAIGASRPQRMAVQQRVRHVMSAAKVADLEDVVKADKKNKKKEEEEDEFEGDAGLSPQQVETFLNVLCEETDIAEVELKMGGFKMKVRRSLKAAKAAEAAAAAAAAPAPAPAPVAAAPAPAPAPAAYDVEASYDSDTDESVMTVAAPKVGVLRRGRYLKGKQVGKGPMVEPGTVVKKGQVIAYVEQLGTHWPVECPQAGEIAAFLVDEGEAVEYLQPVVEIYPSFGLIGHKEL